MDFRTEGFIVSPTNIRDMFKDMNIWPFGLQFDLAHGLVEPEIFILKNGLLEVEPLKYLTSLFDLKC